MNIAATYEIASQADNTIPQLPNIDRVDVLDLGGRSPSLSDGLITSSRLVKIEDEAAQEIATRWRQLTPGISSRCHTPPFGLRFYFENRVMLQASMCWQCNNMYVWEGDGKELYGLDVDQPSAQDLLSKLNDAMN